MQINSVKRKIISQSVNEESKFAVKISKRAKLFSTSAQKSTKSGKIIIFKIRVKNDWECGKKYSKFLWNLLSKILWAKLLKETYYQTQKKHPTFRGKIIWIPWLTFRGFRGGTVSFHRRSLRHLRLEKKNSLSRNPADNTEPMDKILEARYKFVEEQFR